MHSLSGATRETDPAEYVAAFAALKVALCALQRVEEYAVPVTIRKAFLEGERHLYRARWALERLVETGQRPTDEEMRCD